MKAVITRFDQGVVYARGENPADEPQIWDDSKSVKGYSNDLAKFEKAEAASQELTLHLSSYCRNHGGGFANNTCSYLNGETMHKGDVIEVVIVNNQFRIK